MEQANALASDTTAIGLTVISVERSSRSTAESCSPSSVPGSTSTASLSSCGAFNGAELRPRVTPLHRLHPQPTHAAGLCPGVRREPFRLAPSHLARRGRSVVNCAVANDPPHRRVTTQEFSVVQRLRSRRAVRTPTTQQTDQRVPTFALGPSFIFPKRPPADHSPHPWSHHRQLRQLGRLR